MFLLGAFWVVGKLQVIRSTKKQTRHTPWPCEWMHQLFNFAMLGDGPSGTSSKNNVANRIHTRIQTARFDELTVPTALLVNK
jgi:hypothetical protein